MAKGKTNKICINCGTLMTEVGITVNYCSIECNLKHVGYKNINGCHEWNGVYHGNGYGKLTFQKKQLITHRLICEKVHGPSDGIKNHVLHSCDNRKCMNPDHLRWGSAQDNMDDMKNKNRHRIGNKNGMSILTEDQVKDIVQMIKNKNKKNDIMKYISDNNINVSYHSIYNIKCGKAWKHISGF